jgi:hypothetical protein
MHVLGRGTLVTPPLHFCKCTLSFPTLLYCVIDGVFNGEFWSFLTAIDTDFLPPLPSPLSLSTEGCKGEYVNKKGPQHCPPNPALN